MYALPFDSVADADGIDVQDLFPNPLDTFHGGSNASLADQIMFWVNNEYKSLYLFSNPSAATRHNKWINPGTVPDASWGTKNMPSTLKLKGGTAFWIKRYVATTVDKTDKTALATALPELTVSVSGQVVTKQSGTTSYAITPASDTEGRYTLVAAGFTAPFIPNIDLVDPSKQKHDWIADGCKGGTNASAADQLMLWYAGEYKSLYLFSNPSAATRHNYWINPGTVPDASWGTKNMPSTLQIQPTQGFWYYRTKGATGELNFTIAQPYSL